MSKIKKHKACRHLLTTISICYTMLSCSGTKHVLDSGELANSSSYKINSYVGCCGCSAEYFNIYSKDNIDLVFSGHAHGGQVRLPFIGGLYAPGQGLFPKYTRGIYKQNNTSMVVSRGLGNSIFPIRVFNRPELVVVTLKNGF